MDLLRLTASLAGFLALAPGSADAYPLGRVGDSLEAPNSLRGLACADDARIVGLKIRAGGFVDQITLLCQRVQGDQYVGHTVPAPSRW